MSKLGISTGINPNDGLGDSLLAGAIKINSNFNEIYSAIGNGIDITNTIGYALTAGIATFAGISSQVSPTININTSGIITASRIVAGGPSTFTEDLLVNRNLRVSGILTVGTSSIIIDGNNNTVNIGSGVTIDGNSGIIRATEFYADGVQVGVITAESIIYEGSVLENLWSTNNLGITTSSNVGIGTTNASSKLTIVGNASISGVTTTNSLSIGSTQVISSNRQLQNITSLDSITTETIETAISNAPNTFTDLNITGITTLSTTTILELTVSGVTTSTGGFVGNLQGNVTGIATTAINANNLDNQSPSYYLDYNNFTNSPTNLSDFSNDVGFATETYVNIAVANLVNSAPETLDTLNELAAALGDDPNFATTITNELSNKANLSGASFSGVVTATSFVGDGSNLTGISSFSGDYTDLTNTPVNLSDFSNDVGFITSFNDVNYWTETSVGIHTLSNVGIGTTNPTEELEVSGTIKATSFIGNGSGLTGLLGVGSGVEIQENGSPVGTAATINFGSNLDVNFVGGVANIDATGGGGAIVTISDTEPVSPAEGNLWYDSTISRGFIYYVDQDSSQWVDFSPSGGGSVGGGESYWVETFAGIHTLSNVGIGTTNPTSALTVTGNGIFTGVVTATTFSGDGSGLTGVVGSGSGIVIKDSGSLVGTAGTIDFGDNLSVSIISAGVVTVTGSAGGGSSQWVTTGVGIHTLSNVGVGTTNPTSALTVSGDITASSLRGYNALVGTASSTIKSFTVLSVTKTSNHRYFGTGSAIGYHIDGVESPFLTLLPGKTYRFTQDDGSNSTHQLRFYYQADKTTEFTTNVTTNGTAGSAGAYTQIVVTDTTPIVLHYQCINHGYMGNAANFSSNVVDTPYQITARSGINVTGVVTATSFSGSGSGLTNIPSNQLSGALPAIDGSALTGVVGVGAGVEIQENGSPVGTAVTINFGTNLDVSFAGGVATVDATGGGGSSQFVTTAVGIHTLSNVGIGTTNPTSALTVVGDASISGVVTATSFVGSLTGTATSTTNIPNLTGDITSVNSVTSIATGVIVNADINASAGIVDTKLATIATALKVSNSATTATNANTASAIVARDGSGNFSAGTITANLTGTASNVTTNANLTGDITSTGNATAIATGVIVNADINASAGIVDTKLATISTAGKVSNSATTATNANTASAIVARDGSGNFTAGTITATTFSGSGSGLTGLPDFTIIFTISATGSADYIFSGPGIVAGNTNDPILYLYKGFTYTFINTTGGSHPFAIRVSNGGASYTPGVSGSTTGTQTFIVPMNAPSTLYYQCTIHSGMGNVINIV